MFTAADFADTPREAPVTALDDEDGTDILGRMASPEGIAMLVRQDPRSICHMIAQHVDTNQVTQLAQKLTEDLSGNSTLTVMLATALVYSTIATSILAVAKVKGVGGDHLAQVVSLMMQMVAAGNLMVSIEDDTVDRFIASKREEGEEA